MDYILDNKVISAQFEQATIYLTGELTTEKSDYISQTLLYYEQIGCSNITLYLCNTPGGRADCCKGICDILNHIKKKGILITTIAIGEVASASALIFCCGSNRFISSNATLMLHGVLLCGQGLTGNVQEISKALDTLNKENTFVVNLICDATHKERNMVQNDISYDHYFTSEQAVDYNLATGIWE